MDIQRMWINQPSTSQPLHKLHGTNVLAIREGDGWRIYFLSGAVISQQAPFDTLSNGWTQSRTKVPLHQTRTCEIISTLEITYEDQ